MFIQEMLKDREVKKYDKEVEEAIKIFDKQKESLRNIQNTDGWKAITEYLETVIEANESALDIKYDQRKFSDLMAGKRLYRFLTSRVEK
uniref:Uncharacterized protein n=1 Tax=uncultured marine virus TaxID=186617 RepID=A0A0F7L370_9VIRU|nr:hypothetical protein [uncultured marine virus]